MVHGLQPPDEPVSVVHVLGGAGCEVGVEGAGVAGEVLTGTELERVDEDRRDEGVGERPSMLEQLDVSVVQRTHCGDERHGAVAALVATNSVCQGRQLPQLWPHVLREDYSKASGG